MKEVKGWSSLVEEFSPTFYGFCTVGGILSAGTTHLAITPLDVFKVKMQDFPISAYRHRGTLPDHVLKDFMVAQRDSDSKTLFPPGHRPLFNSATFAYLFILFSKKNIALNGLFKSS
uniref:Uncharacterized protein n=1 Tax=Populus trichocarpa TaxID=3694 RepID=B9I866_POPTR